MSKLTTEDAPQERTDDLISGSTPRGLDDDRAVDDRALRTAETAGPRDKPRRPAPNFVVNQGRRLMPGWALVLRSGAGRAQGFLRVWTWWEALRGHFVPPILDIPGDVDGLLGVQFIRWHGDDVTLPDGTVVRAGDPLAWVHIRNERLARTSSTALDWEILHQFRRDMKALAAWVQSGTFPQPARALYGMTILGAPSRRLGFTLRPLPPTFQTRLQRFFLQGLIVIYHPHGRERLREGHSAPAQVVQVWMSLEELLRRYGNA